MKRIGIEALYRKPNTSKPTPGHTIYPYLLRGMTIDHPNQVWAMDITYVPMRAASSISPPWWTGSAGGFSPGGCRSPWRRRSASRRWRRRWTARPARGLQHRSGSAVHQPRLHQRAAKAGIAISMDGKGSWRDNVFVERLWRSIKYEEVYLRAYDTVGEARASIGRYLNFYNGWRPHSSLDRQTPDQAYFTRLPQSVAA